MTNFGTLLALVLVINYTILPVAHTPAAATLDLYGTFHAMGITVAIAATGDPNENAIATVAYRKAGEPYRVGFPLSRISNTRFVGSLFWLEPGTGYEVQVRFSDPDGDPLGNVTLQATASTQTEIVIPSAHDSLLVSPTGSGTTCSLAVPCALLEAISRAQPGDEIVLRGGVYYAGAITLPRSGTPGAPIVIRGYNDETAILDGADPAPLSWTAIGDGIYATSTDVQEIGLVTANGARLYPYENLASLQSLRWGLPGFYADGSKLYLHLAGAADPDNAAIIVSRYNRGFEVEQNYIYFLNLTFRHYGQGSEARAIYFKHASHNLVQNSVFALNNGGITVRDGSHRNVIQDNEFYDTIAAWPWDAVKATGLLERGGVYFAGSTSVRGNVIRRNIFHDYFDGFDVCPSEPLPGEPIQPTNETDVYDNLVYNMGDDGVQVDGWCSNIRLWNNTFHDVLVGVSLAPMVGGPVYAIRNLIYRFGVGNSEYIGDSFKFNNSNREQTGPVYLIHNTTVAVMPESSGLELSSGSSNGWALVYARNNIWTGINHALRNKDISYPVNLDYDNLWNADNGDLVRWDNTKYTSLAAFSAATGQEPHGFNLDPGFVGPQAGDYTLNSLSPLIDAGVLIPGINDGYEGAAPDIGAFEFAPDAARYVYLPLVAVPASSD